MLDRIEQQPRIGHFPQRAVEILCRGQALPERAAAVFGDEVLRARAQ